MMPILEIKKYPLPSLKVKAKKVYGVTVDEKRILDDMAETMYLNQGVGLAATQVGIDRQLAVIDVGEGLIKLVNPTITSKKGSAQMEEGCLSIPGIQVKIRRARGVSVSALNESGEPVNFTASGLFARAIQHEVDHLTGKLIIDYLNPLRRFLLKKKAAKKI